MSGTVVLDWRGLMCRLIRDRSGVAFMEFALALPILIVLAASGLELANYVIATKRIGEVAALVADNASRMGDQRIIKNIPIAEAEILDVFVGADLQARGLNLERNGRIILSSLERRAADGPQKIGWQRCFGDLPHPSSYGVQGQEVPAGMGPAGAQVTAAPKTAVMVVEIAYEYEQLVPLIGLSPGIIREFAAFNVRDDRDLSSGVNPTPGIAESSCT